MKKTVLFLVVAMISMYSVAQITVPENLYFIGAASPNGWAADQATPMTKTVNGDVTTFTWLGLFGAGEFRFLDQLNQWCGFGAQITVEDVVISELHAVIPTCGNNFNLLAGGTYLMTITMTAEYATMRIEPEASVYVPAEIWATGSALSNTIVKLPKLPDGKFLYGGQLQTGELKFMDTETVSASTRYIVPKSGSTSIIDLSDSQITTSASSPGWSVTVGDLPYKVRVNVAAQTVTGAVFFPYDNLYIIGGCTSADWNPAKAIPLLRDVENSSVFIFDGELNFNPSSVDNGFRFLAQLGWGDGFGSNSENEPLIGSQYVIPGSGTNWTISESQQGHYEIRVNTLLETIEAVFDPAPVVNPTDVWAYGTAVSNEPVKLTKLPDGTFFYPGKFKVGELKFIDTETIGANTRYIVPATGSAPIAGQTVYRIKNDATLPGWNISSASPFYKVKVNVSAKTVNGEYYSSFDEMYIVGGCTPNGWDAENAIPLVQDPEDLNVFIFDGVLRLNPEEADNGFRFIGQAGWGAIRFAAYVHGTPITAAQYYLPNLEDYNWTIDESQQGRYIIKVNTQYETIETQFVGGTDIKTIQSDSYFKVLPSTGGVTIAMTDGYTAERVQVIDIAGRVVETVQNAAGKFSVGNQLSKGVYIVKIDCQGQSSVQKVLVK
ncbi:hypothetical protein FACS1894162_1620 [Bacteroidia bacterium]|nr:hypothetical protein FACS1894162_1620 [Bacteroidia bacterium]